MTDTIMLEAPARGGRISDLADGQGRILRLHDLTASSLGHTSHANQTESPTRTGGRVTIERKPDEGDGPAVIHRLNDERDQRWQNLIVGFLIHASRGIVRHDGQHEYTAVPDGPWRTSAPYASSLSGAADNRWGGRDKRKDIHRKKERSWERNQTHTHTIRTAWTSTTRPTTRTSWDALTPGKHSDHDFYPRYRKRDTWKQ